MEQTLAALRANDPSWRAVLAAYGRAEQSLACPPTPSAPLLQPSSGPASGETDAAAGPQSTELPRRRPAGVPRLTTVEGVPDDELSSIHGRLIAEGLLQFDVLSREEGLVYRLTREARLALAAWGDEDAAALADEAALSIETDCNSAADDAAEGDVLPEAA